MLLIRLMGFKKNNACQTNCVKKMLRCQVTDFYSHLKGPPNFATICRQISWGWGCSISNSAAERSPLETRWVLFKCPMTGGQQGWRMMFTVTHLGGVSYKCDLWDIKHSGLECANLALCPVSHSAHSTSKADANKRDCSKLCLGMAGTAYQRAWIDAALFEFSRTQMIYTTEDLALYVHVCVL